MNEDLLRYLVAIVVVSTAMIAWVLNTWIRARHGIPTDEELALRAVQQDRNVPLLVEQNERLTNLVSKLEERIAVLERIVTDPAERTAREIETLR